MIGSTENENGWVGPPPYELPDAEMLELFTTQLANNDATDAQKLLALYKRRHPETRNRMLWLMAESDDSRRWNAQLLCRLKHEQGTAPAYLYFFDWQSPVHNNRMGSYHTPRHSVRVLQHGHRRIDDGLGERALRARARHERRVGRVRAHGQSEPRRHAELADVRAERLCRR